MNKFRFTSKWLIFAIISSAVIVLGMALGTAMHFAGGGFFNFGGEYASCKTVTVSYVYTEFGSEEELETICENVFSDAGLKNYKKVSSGGGVTNSIIYKFSVSAADQQLSGAVSGINTRIAEATKEFSAVPQSRAAFGNEKVIMGGERALTMGAIALAVIVAAHAVYSVIRHKLSGLIIALALQAHNIGLYAALLALCRVPVTSSALTFAVILSLITAAGLSVLLDLVKRERKNAADTKITLAETVDMGARKAFVANNFLCAVTMIAGVLASVSSPLSALCAMVAVVTGYYGIVFAAPAAYPAICGLCGKIAKKPSQQKAK